MRLRWAPGIALIVCVVALGYVLIGRGEEEGSGASIKRLKVDGQDIADILQIPTWKFQINLPKGRYSISFWVEEWTKGVDHPVVRAISSQSYSPGVGDLLVKLPDPTDREVLVQLGGSARGALDRPKVLQAGHSTEVLDDEPIELGHEICLVALARIDGDSFSAPDSRKLDKHREGTNAETLYFKCYITKGDELGIARWRDGKIVFEH